MERTFAIVEREMRRFRRSPTLIVMSLIMPIVQLVVLGYAFGGQVKNLKLGVVDQDRGMPAVHMRELAGAVAANAKTFVPVQYPDLGQAVQRAARTASSTACWRSRRTSRAACSRRTTRASRSSRTTPTDSSRPRWRRRRAAWSARTTSRRRRRGACRPTTSLDVVEVYPYVPVHPVPALRAPS